MGDILAIVGLILAPVVPKFAFSPLNDAAVVLLLWALPISLLGVTATAALEYEQWLRLPLFLAGLLLLVVAFPVSLLSLTVGSEEIAELEAPFGTFRAYRTNGGATTSYRIALRREYDVLPGLRLVSRPPRCSFDRAYRATLTRLSDRKGRLTVSCKGCAPRACDFDL